MFKIWYNTGVVYRIVNIGNLKKRTQKSVFISVNQQASIEEGLKIDSFKA